MDYGIQARFCFSKLSHYYSKICNLHDMGAWIGESGSQCNDFFYFLFFILDESKWLRQQYNSLKTLTRACYGNFKDAYCQQNWENITRSYIVSLSSSIERFNLNSFPSERILVSRRGCGGGVGCVLCLLVLGCMLWFCILYAFLRVFGMACVG
jgi:hypothetical protein